MKHALALGVLVAMVTWSRPASAETTVLLYLGTSFTYDSTVRLQFPGGTDLRYEGVPWASRSFQLPIYYGLRITHHFNASPGVGVALDFVHDKAYADTERPLRVTGTRAGQPVAGTEPLGTSLQSFNMSHGVNYLTLNGLYRWNTCPESGCTGRVQPYAGLGLGVAIPHVEAILGEQSVYRYQLRAPVLQALGGVSWPFASYFGVFGEYRFSHAFFDVDIPGGTLGTTLSTHHLVAGPVFRIPGL